MDIRKMRKACADKLYLGYGIPAPDSENYFVKFSVRDAGNAYGLDF